MPEPTTPATPQAGGTGDTSPQAGNTTPTTPQAGNVKTPEDYERMIAELRKENAAHRTKLSKFEQDELARQQAALSDLEKASKRAEQAEQRIKQQQEELVLSKVQLAAHSKGIVDPELAAMAILASAEKDENGMPKDLDKALDALIEAKPWLKAQAGQTAAQTGNSGPPQTPANNPGRGAIVQQGTLPAGRITMDDLYRTYKKT